MQICLFLFLLFLFYNNLLCMSFKVIPRTNYFAIWSIGWWICKRVHPFYSHIIVTSCTFLMRKTPILPVGHGPSLCQPWLYWFVAIFRSEWRRKGKRKILSIWTRMSHVEFNTQSGQESCYVVVKCSLYFKSLSNMVRKCSYYISPNTFFLIS